MTVDRFSRFSATSHGGDLIARAGHGLAPVVLVPIDSKRFVYVLQSLRDPSRQFVESAAQVSTRVAVHNAGHSPLTATHRPWRLAAVVQFADERTAVRFEKYLKTQAGRTLARQFFGRDDSA